MGPRLRKTSQIQHTKAQAIKGKKKKAVGLYQNCLSALANYPTTGRKNKPQIERKFFQISKYNKAVSYLDVSKITVQTTQTTQIDTEQKTQSDISLKRTCYKW